ncbi:class I SAM-dependent methyltransferase [Helicobacter mesocricetorum]|uniref:class I SAM-dependent methyltransferase n=1 Tax=Helicobacter mesocricetorum TaxID=87012 RepID=UPI000CF09417|nr:class I SAM-dependent methyltransferase [Helicobacter mesocricetorum]
MQHWNEGYFSDFSYTKGYYRVINPLLMNFHLALAGVKSNTINDEGEDISPPPEFNYLELGFGMGISVNIHAATTRGNYTAIDFNPQHMAYANTYAKSDNITLYNDSFKEFLARLEQEKITFDYICFHGIFSWISKENRDILLEIVYKFLKVGGVVYNSYNCYPQQIFALPIKEILFLHHQLNHSTNINANDQVLKSMDFIAEFTKTNPLFMKNSDVASFITRIQNMKDSGISYLAHEYLNADWKCFYFYEIAKMMENIKCSFAVNTEPLDHLDSCNLNEDARNFLSNIADPIFKEQLKDYYVSRNFRGDIFVKGIQRFAHNASMQRILNTEFVLISPITAFKYQMEVVLGTLTLDKDLYKKALEYLQSQSYRPKSGSEIMSECKIDFSSLATLIIVLIKQEMLFPTQKIDKTIKDRAKTYNEILFNQQLEDETNVYVAAPLIGSCIAVSSIEQLVMKTYLDSVKDKENLALKTFELFKKYGKKVVEEGVVVQEDSENIKRIEVIVKGFMEKLPLYKVLGILD